MIESCGSKSECAPELRVEPFVESGTLPSSYLHCFRVFSLALMSTVRSVPLSLVGHFKVGLCCYSTDTNTSHHNHITSHQSAFNH